MSIPYHVSENSTNSGVSGLPISGSTFLADGGATASYFYGPLKPET